jgi:hypothetical protein
VAERLEEVTLGNLIKDNLLRTILKEENNPKFLRIVESNRKYSATIEEQLSQLSSAISATVSYLETVPEVKFWNEEVHVQGLKKVTRVVLDRIFLSLAPVQMPTGSTSGASTPIKNSAVADPTVEDFMEDSLKMRTEQPMEPGWMAPITTAHGGVAHMLDPLLCDPEEAMDVDQPVGVVEDKAREEPPTISGLGLEDRD